VGEAARAAAARRCATLNEAVFYGLVGGALGAALGSFLGCAWYRIPNRLSLLGRSSCPACSRPIAARWNVPLLGYLLLRGRAACCGARLSASYPLLEGAMLATGAFLGALLGARGLGLLCALTALFALALRARARAGRA
jgi:leader peptidase (prepilin peptidase)/N-methyltransferase